MSNMTSAKATTQSLRWRLGPLWSLVSLLLIVVAATMVTTMFGKSLQVQAQYALVNLVIVVALQLFIGTSGVGKSSLINRLVGGTLQPTLEVRDSDSKGRHATTWREIIPVPQGGLVIDTPGMREFHLWSADLGLDTAFPDITELAKGCRFRDCTHGAEPGCAVRSALETGALVTGRYESFRKLQAELVEVDRGRVEQERRVRSSRPKPSLRHGFPLDEGEGEE